MHGCKDTENIELRIDEQRAIELELISGSLFGDYIDWVDRFSKYGKVAF
jgi:hypothetical protein